MTSEFFFGIILYTRTLLHRFNTRPIRRQIDTAYKILHQLCNVLEGKSCNSKKLDPHELRIEESDQLLTGLKKTIQ
jgi:hypothetical protein